MKPSLQVRSLSLLPLFLIGGFFLLTAPIRPSTADTANGAVFGPELFQRDQGRPQTYLRQFSISDASGSYNLGIINGEPDDSEDFKTQKKSRTSSAQIFLNDTQIVSSSDITKDVRRLSVPVVPRSGQNTLKVILQSNPITMLSVSVARADTSAPPDLTPPQVIAVSPANGAVGVPVSGTQINITFSEPIRLDTLSATSFYLTAGGQNVSGSITPAPDASVAIFSASTPLAYSTTYAVTVTTAIKDVAGNSLAASFLSVFTTEAAPPPPAPAPDVTPPRVTSLSPQAGSLDNQNSVPVVVTFSELVDAATVRDNLLVFADTAQGGGTVVVQDGGSFMAVPNGERVEGSVELSQDGLKASFTPTSTSSEGTSRPARLPANASITVVVTTRVKDLARNSLDQNPQLSGSQLFGGTFSTSAFNLTGSTTVARVNHQAAGLDAALLPGDQVLLSGGFNELNQVNATADVYNAGEGTFRSLTMIEGRAEHTVTVLNNGKVLIAGGIGANGEVLSSAELYDPRTGVFSPAGSMHTPRFRHTATLLADGSVLIAGGYNAAALNTAEIFFSVGSTFPVSNAFVDVAARMSATRAYHTATALQDGSVLLCGGLSNGLVLDTAEVFVPTPFAAQLGQFVSGGGTGLLWKMSTARFRHTATLLPNGQVLIAGGKDNALRTLNTAEVFKPSQVLALSSFSASGQLTEARADHSATLLPDGFVLIAGGWASNQAASSSTAEIYRSGRFTRTRSRLTNGRSSHAAVLLSDGTVLLSNGENGSEALRSAETYTARP
jgi:hypothetical protein